MKIRVPSYFEDFKCIASACEDTCCAGWGIVIDDQTHKRYQTIEGAFGETLRSKIVEDEDGDNVFILNGDDCPFLDKEHLCDIYKELGPDYLCHTCRQFPRYMEEFLDLREMGLSLSCPEAARIIIGNQEATTFALSEDDQAADADERIDGASVETFLQWRDSIIGMMEMPDVPLAMRMGSVLAFVEEVQDKIDFDEMDDIDAIVQDYTKSSFIEGLHEELEEYKGNEEVKYEDVAAYFKTYSGLEHINANDPLGLEKVLRYLGKGESGQAFYSENHRAFNTYYEANMYKFKNIFVYFIFRYFMKSVFDYDVSSKVKLAMMSTIIIKELAVVRWLEKRVFTEADMVEISRMYSKDVEHLEANIDILQKIFETEEVYQMDNILMTVMNEF